MANRSYAKAVRAHEIAVALDIPFGAAWRVAACVSKVSYATEDEARAAAESWDAGNPQRAYVCDICRRWHLSSERESR